MEDIKNNYHTLDAEKVKESLETDSENGLSRQEVERRLEQFGRNILERKEQKSILQVLLGQFANPIIWVLIVAASLALLFGEILEGIAVTIVILINTLIGFFMEWQAVRSMEKLRNLARSHAKVFRDSQKKEIDSADIVPGDVIYVEPGDVVAADARLIKVNNLAIKEAALTGESAPVDKQTEALPEDTQVADRINSMFKGTVVTRGNGRGIVVATGADTELGKISEMAQEAKKEFTPLNKRLRELSRKLIWLTLILTGLILLAGVVRGKEWLIMVETAIALAVASIPEGLPVISTISLARGMVRLADKNVIVKTLEAVQTLGETKVIFTDKTGTLTENRMFVDTIAFDNILERVSSGSSNKLKDHPDFDLFLIVSVLCNDSVFRNGEREEEESKKKHNRREGDDNEKALEDSSGDPVEIALLRMAQDLGEDPDRIKEKYPRVTEVPFDSDLKMMGTLNKTDDGYLICVKGATEEVLKKCVRVHENGKTRDLQNQKEWMQRVDELAAKGLRVLSFGYRKTKEKPGEKDFIHDLTFLGIAGFIDPPRADVKEAIKDCKDAGIKVVMVTGDHPGTASAIAEQVGLTDAESKIITIHGKELKKEEELSDDEREKLLKANVFSRVNPAQKLDLVKVYQQRKIIVGMTGDGINDAPALKKADIGIAMGIRGTEAAKEAADLILKDDAFPSIVLAIRQGRVIFENIRTFVVYLLSCNLSEILIVAVASFFNLPLPLMPLQILFLNMITDVFPALAIGMNAGEGKVMKKPPRESTESIISKPLWISIVAYGLSLTVAVIGVEIYTTYRLQLEQEVVNNITFYTLILAQLWNVFNLPEADISFVNNQITKNKFIWYALILCIILVLVAYIIPPVRLALDLVVLDQSLLGLVFVTSLIPIGLVQVLKRIFKVIK